MCNATTLLNRIVERRRDGIPWELDPRQTELIIRDLGLNDAKKAATPRVREHNTRRSGEEAPVDCVLVKSADGVGDVHVREGDKIHVRGHDAAHVVQLRDGWKKGRMQVEYDDGT